MLLCINGDGNPRSERSKKGYCKDCAAKARTAWKEMISAGAEAKSEREAAHEALWKSALFAGAQAGAAVIPQPMVVQERAHVLDDNSPVVEEWVINDGVCGFAWVSVRPGNSSFARWLVKNGHGSSDSYAGGITIWISAYGQSMTRKSAHAAAMARVLREAGIKAYSQDRID